MKCCRRRRAVLAAVSLVALLMLRLLEVMWLHASALKQLVCERTCDASKVAAGQRSNTCEHVRACLLNKSVPSCTLSHRRVDVPDERLEHSARGFRDRKYWHWRPLWSSNATMVNVTTVAGVTSWHEPPAGVVRQARAGAETGRTRCDVRGRHVIYLTYDDTINCSGERTCGLHEDFLDETRALDAQVTLFALGGQIASHPRAAALFAEYRRRGHQLGSHTHTHIDVARTAVDVARDDVDEADRVLSAAAGGMRIKHFRAPNTERPRAELLAHLREVRNYTLWGGLNGAGTDWSESWLPSALRSKFAHAAAQLVQRAMVHDACGASEKRGEDARGDRCAPIDTFSAVLTLHDRPHSLRSVRQYAEEICAVCPRCEFRGLPDDVAACATAHEHRM